MVGRTARWRMRATRRVCINLQFLRWQEHARVQRLHHGQARCAGGVIAGVRRLMLLTEELVEIAVARIPSAVR